MTRLRLCLLATLLCVAPAVAEAAKVNIIRPPKHRYVEAPAPGPVTVNLQVVVVALPVDRRRRVDRQLFQRWTGFIRQYSGRRYPF